MATAEQIADLVEAGDFDALEDAWLAALQRRPLPTASFVEAIRRLRDHDEMERAGFLLELLFDQLESRSDDQAHLELLRSVGEMLHPDPAALHAEITGVLVAIHGSHESFRDLYELVGLHRAIEDTPKAWTKVDRLLELLAYPQGAIVYLRNKGPGRVSEVNMALKSLRVDVEGMGTISVGFAAVGKMLEPLPPEHVLYRLLEDPEGLAKIASEAPDELARITLESYDEPLTANEIRQAIGDVVGDGEWTSFWSRARKNPQLVALPGGRHRYRWAATAGDAVTELREQFDGAELAERIELFKSHSERDPEFRDHMVGALAAAARGLAGSDPAAAYEVAATLERAGVDLAGEPFAQDELLRSVDEPLRLIERLSDSRLRDDAYGRLPAIDEHWVARFCRAITQESEAKLLDRLAARVVAKDIDAFDRVVGELLTHPGRNPGAFTWLAERAAEDERLLARRPLRLFRQILAAIGDGRFSSQRRRLEKLLDSGATLPRLLPHLDPSQAAAAVDALERASSLDEFQRNPLKTAIELRFPELREEAEAPLYAREESITRKREELRALLEEEIPANRRAIEEARELGDLRENFEYKSARQRHEYLTARATALDEELRRARPIAFASIDPSSVRIGTTVRLGADGGRERSITILGPWESDPEGGVLSNEAEAAKVLLGSEVGERVEVEGVAYTVLGIELAE